MSDQNQDDEQGELASDESQPSTENASAQAVDAERSTMSPMLWFAAGLIGAVVMPIVVQLLLSDDWKIPLPEEFYTVNSETFDQSGAMAIEAENRAANFQRFLIGPGMVMAIVFGLFSGIISRRIGLGILGVAVGCLVAYLIPQAATAPLLELERNAAGANDGLAIGLHAAEWGIFGLAGWIALAIGSGRLSFSLKALVAMGVAAVLGALLYVIGGIALDPQNSTSVVAPLGGAARYLWTSLPPLLAGSILARTKP